MPVNSEKKTTTIMIRILKELFCYRELLWYLMLRDIKIRYKQAVLGILWTFFMPLAMMLIFTFIFSRMTQPYTQTVPYPLFVLCGILPWMFFSSSLSMATVCLEHNYHLVTEVYFPREIFPIAAIMAKGVDFIIGGIFFIGFMMVYKVSFHRTLLFIPIVILLQCMLTVGIGAMLAMANLFFRDVKYFFNILLSLWFFATPVVYPVSVVESSLRWVLYLNPLTPLIETYRSLVLFGRLPDALTSLSILTIPVIFLMVGLIVFKRFEHLFAEYI